MNETIETSLHPTTVSCLEALQWLSEKHRWANVLDIGCGDGILSLVAASVFDGCRVLAADIAPQAVADTQHKFSAFGKGLETVVRSDGFNHPLIKERAPYDLIICNLLAEPLIEWSGLVKAHLAPGGVCLLSGILTWLSPELEEAYERQGFAMIHSVTRSPWMTHVMRLP